MFVCGESRGISSGAMRMPASRFPRMYRLPGAKNMGKCYTSNIPIYLVFLIIFSFNPTPLIAQVQSSGGDSKKAPASPAPSGPPSGPSSNNKGSSSSQNGKQTNVSIQSKLAEDALVFSDAGDYVPCEFSRADLLSLRPQPDVFTLSSADEETLRARIIADALEDSNAGAFTPNQRDAFGRDVAPASDVGLTPSQATGKTLFLLAQNTAAPPSVSDLLKWAANSNEQFPDYL